MELLVARDTPQSVLDAFNEIQWANVTESQLSTIISHLQNSITARKYPLRGRRASGPKVGQLKVATGVPQSLLDVANTIYWPDVSGITLKRLVMELRTGATVMNLPKR